MKKLLFVLPFALVACDPAEAPVPSNSVEVNHPTPAEQKWCDRNPERCDTQIP